MTKHPRIAFVYDRVTKWGGAERVLLALHDMWPEAPLYTAFYDPSGAPWASVFDVRPSILNKIPGANKFHELFPLMTSWAFESFDFDAYDLVISITSAEAKNVITKTHTTHVCYCLTPTRYLWSGSAEYQKNPGLGIASTAARIFLSLFGDMLRHWDTIGAARPDMYIAISQRVARRIEQYYNRHVTSVMYPPVDIAKFQLPKDKQKEPYFLVVSRLVGYKRVDLIIDTFNTLGLPLLVIGDGRQKEELVARAGPTIRFVHDYLTDDKLVAYYQKSQALVFAGEEDFGLVAVEAQACGTPVISFRDSGMAEAIEDKKTGILYDKQSQESLSQAIAQFQKMTIDPMDCRRQARKFSQEIFKKAMRQTIEGLAKGGISL